MASALKEARRVDAVIVGAGIAGMYMLHRLRALGLETAVFEAGDDVGGTWYWNRYPGARCDVESVEYSYSFSPELEQEWEWTERYPAQPEILRYLQHVAERFDLRSGIQFETRVTSARYDEKARTWRVETDRGDVVDARFCVMATGCLSSWSIPDFEGVDDFEGPTYHTGDWPHEGVDFTGKRVGLIGTGSSAIQSIPQIAKQAEHLFVFQRTPNYSVPAQNRPLTDAEKAEVKADYPALRERARRSPAGTLYEISDVSALSVDDTARRAEYDRRWDIGGATMLYAFNDLAIDPAANETIAEYVRERIRDTVHDPAVAALLTPTDYPLGTKRICIDIDYFETYNRDNISLVDVRSAPIEAITPTGLRTADGAFEFDALVFATGFDAMTGALAKIDIVGRGGEALRDEWAAGPRTYLGLMSAGFPNLFLVTGPGSPSVLSNMVVSIEQHVDWITDCITHLRDAGAMAIEPTLAAQDAWVDHVNQTAAQTLYMKAASWYLGANIPGKPRVFMPYVGGVGAYRALCDEVVDKGYEGFQITAA